MKLPADVLSKIHLPEEIEDTLKQHEDLVKFYDEVYSFAPSRATFYITERGDYPPGSAYRKKIGPLDWLTYYSEEKAKIPTTIENGVEMFEKEPVVDMSQQFSEPYLKELMKIERKWLSRNL